MIVSGGIGSNSTNVSGEQRPGDTSTGFASLLNGRLWTVAQAAI